MDLNTFKKKVIQEIAEFKRLTLAEAEQKYIAGKESILEGYHRYNDNDYLQAAYEMSL